MQGFKEFILRGNVIELAVAVVIGTAFTAIVTAIVDGIFTPIIAQFSPTGDIEGVTWGIIQIGSVLAAIINFVLVAAVVYFALVLPMAKVKEAQARRRGDSPAEAAETEVDVLHDIRELLKAQQTPPRV